MKREIILVVDSVRSTHNVGAFFRTTDGFGVSRIVLTGITPFPKEQNDRRLPHLANKINQQIHKTALGAEQTVAWQYVEDIGSALRGLRIEGFQIIALEQTEGSVALHELKAKSKVALIVGGEIDGVRPEALELSDVKVEIAMSGQKESFNVSVAAGIALFYLRYSWAC